ncbi:hypothetical protein ACLB2K_011106 [Fragaria x ananassa]
MEQYTTKSGKPLKMKVKFVDHEKEVVKASDALPLPLYFTNAVFFTLFFSVVYFLLTSWREKIRTNTGAERRYLSEIVAIIAFVASFIYLLGFFGMDFVQSLILQPSNDIWAADDDEDIILKEDARKVPCGQALDCSITKMAPIDSPKAAPKVVPKVFEEKAMIETPPPTEEDEEIIKAVVAGTIPSYSLETKLGDCKRAASIRREALQRVTGKSLEGLPLEGFDYESILGQCCEMPVGYITIPVGIAGPLMLNGREFSVPMATTEGCLVASTNRGCKAINLSGGASSVLLKDGMTRAPVVRFNSAKRAAELKFFMEDPEN